MPLTLILGPANSAKAGVVLDAYKAASRRDALLVVPTSADGAHYDLELTADGTALGRALTFPHLIEEIARRAGYERRQLTALQRERVLARALAAAPLKALAQSASGEGFAPAAGRLVAELRAGHIEAPRFAAAVRQWAEGQSPAVQAFAADLAAIYLRYARAVDVSGLVDEQQYAWGALDALRAAPALWGSTPVYFYGFDDLTTIQLDAVETLSGQVQADVTVSLTYQQDREALKGRARVAGDLREMAASVTELPALDEHYADGSRAALHHLERMLFEPVCERLAPGEAVQLIEAGGALAEAEQVAAEVLAALRAGVAPEQIVVVARSLARSGALLERTLTRYGVAVSSTRRLPVAHTRLGRAVTTLAHLALSPDRDELPAAELIAYLRSSLISSAELDHVDEFEAALRRSGIQTVGAAFAHSAARQLRAKIDPGPLELIDRLHASADPAAVIREATERLLRGLGGADQTGHGGWSRFTPWEGQKRLHPPETASARAAGVILGALQELAALDGGAATPAAGTPAPTVAPPTSAAQAGPAAPPTSAAHAPAAPTPTPAADLLAVLAGLEVPALVATAAEEAVLIAEPLQIRARRFQQVFVTGLCEGEFPGTLTTPDPFLDDERRWEIANAAALRIPQLEDALQRERYLFYVCASRATERVTFSYRTCDEEGKLELASPFLSDVLSLFSDDLYERRIRRPLSDVTWSPGSAPTVHQRRLADAAADGDSQPEPDSAREPATYTLSEAARAHIRGAQVVPAGALVQFARCPLAWFVDRQLNAQDLDPEADPLARGTLMHSLLEETLRTLGAPLSEANLEQALATLERLAREAEHELAPGQDAAVRDAIRLGVVAALRRVLRFSAQHTPPWEPRHFEARFGAIEPDDRRLPALELRAHGETIRVSGTIDRIDVDPSDGARAIVRDYKSGKKRAEWQGERWLADGEIQVALYMLAAQRLLGLDPVAGLYQPLTDPDLRARGTFDETLAPSGETVKGDGVDGAVLRQRLQAVEELAVELGSRLARGELKPCPETCSPDGCRHPWICWGG